MGSKKPHRYDLIDREFPVRLTIRAAPETHEMTGRWLQRHVGTGNYASAPKAMWSDNKALNVYFRNMHDALMFLAGCPHVQLVGEVYRGTAR